MPVAVPFSCWNQGPNTDEETQRKLSDILTEDVETISAEGSLLDAAHKMKDCDAGILRVTAFDRTVSGFSPIETS